MILSDVKGTLIENYGLSQSGAVYLLRTNETDWTSQDLWKAYMQLTEAEAAFWIGGFNSQP